MDIRMMVQGTPNPNALKFVLNIAVIKTGNVTYKTLEECQDNPLAAAIFAIGPAVHEVYFFDNYITVTQDGTADWDDLEEAIQVVINENIKEHDPDIKIAAPKNNLPPIASNDDPEIAKINDILDQTVRPALQMDGGDIQLVSYINNELKVFYQGACGSCPSSTMGTMKAIENILRDQYNPEIVVSVDDMM